MRIRKDKRKKVEESSVNIFWKRIIRKSMEENKVLKNIQNKKVNNNFVCFNKREKVESSQQEDKEVTKENNNIGDEEQNDIFCKVDLSNSALSNHHMQLLKQIDILSFESSDDEILHDNDDDECDEGFQSLANLTMPINAAYLSVFINFTLIHSISEPLLFYIITDLYKKGNLKEMRKWAYEIYSSFIAPTAPLQIFESNQQKETLINEIDSKLMQIEVYKPVENVTSSFDLEMLRLLREIFHKSRIEAQKMISNQLDDFQTKRRAGLEAIYGATSAELKAAKKDKTMEKKFIEKNLMPKLMMMVKDLEENEQNLNRMTLLSALSTVIHQVFRPSVNYFESIDQFVSCENASIKEFYVKGHHMMPKVCYSTTYCDYCQQLLAGISPQGYQCSCGINIHSSCVDMLTGNCILEAEDDDQDHNESKDSSKLMELVHQTLGNQRVENYKRTKQTRPKSDPGVYKQASDSSCDDFSIGESIWSTDLTTEFQKLSENAKKRREIVIELFETERRHVKLLKLLQNVFLEPLKRSKAISPEFANILFPPSFFVIKDWHVSFETMLKKEWHEQHGILVDIGNCLSIFQGTYGDILKENAAAFCSGQQFALEMLKTLRSKSEALQRGLIKAESHKGCKRLQLKDLMLSILQRLTKYPLLFERMLKYSENDDREKIKNACESSKMILDYVNFTVKSSEEIRAIQSKLDKTNYDRDAPMEFKSLNLLNYKLIHNGFVIMKKGALPMRVLLFEKILVLLYKYEERYVLKSCDHMKFPVMKLHSIIIRSNAANTKSFFVIYQNDSHSQMLELIAVSEAEAQNWIQKINDAVEKATNTVTLKRRSSAESAQAIMRSESQSKTTMSKPDLASIAKSLQLQAKYVEEWIQATQKNNNYKNSDQTDSCEVDNINVTLNTLNRLVSQLSMKIAERDHERDLNLKEIQRLRELHK